MLSELLIYRIVSVGFGVFLLVMGLRTHHVAPDQTVEIGRAVKLYQIYYGFGLLALLVSYLILWG